jgi:hypothetical protein
VFLETGPKLLPQEALLAPRLEIEDRKDNRKGHPAPQVPFNHLRPDETDQDACIDGGRIQRYSPLQISSWPFFNVATPLQFAPSVTRAQMLMATPAAGCAHPFFFYVLLPASITSECGIGCYVFGCVRSGAKLAVAAACCDSE